MESTDRVLLIDLENVIGPARSRPALVRTRINALREAAGNVHHVLAGYSVTDPANDAVISVLVELGVAPWPVPPGRDAAETALLQHARWVHQQGGREFAVASGDHRFTALAQLGRVEVLAWEQQPVAKRLEAAAHSVRRLPWPTTASTPATVDRRQPAPAAVATATITHTSQAPAPAPSLPRREPTEYARNLLNGLYVGIGLAVGQRLTERLLRPSRP